MRMHQRAALPVVVQDPLVGSNGRLPAFRVGEFGAIGANGFYRLLATDRSHLRQLFQSATELRPIDTVNSKHDSRSMADESGSG